MLPQGLTDCVNIGACFQIQILLFEINHCDKNLLNLFDSIIQIAILMLQNYLNCSAPAKIQIIQ